MIPSKKQIKLWTLYHEEIPTCILPFLRSESLQRISNIDMYCGMIYTNFPIYRNSPYYSRLEHSIGVASIIYHFTNDIKATLAGLFHDIAAPTFSHTIDFVYLDYLKQEYTESKTKQMITNDIVILEELAKLGLFVKDVNEDRNYPIANNDSPKLCADRIEYLFSTMYGLLNISYESLQSIYQDMIVITNEDGEEEIGFQTPEIAIQFANDALECSKIYVSKEDRYCMERLAQLLRKAIHQGIIEENDFWENERSIISKLKNSSFNEEWASYRKIGKVDTSRNEVKDSYVVHAKKRWINPLIMNHGRTMNYSKEYKNSVNQFLAEDMNEYIFEVKYE